MRTLSHLAAAAVLVFLSAPAIAQDQSNWSFSGGVWGLSDYVWRGVSQTQEDPTWKLELLVEHDTGFYVGAEFYGVDFTPPAADFDDGINYEANLYLGWNHEFSDSLGLDLSYTRIFYPGSQPDYESDFNELEAVLGFGGNYSVTVNYSDNSVNLGHSAWYGRLGGDWELGESGLMLGAAVGVYELGTDLGGSYRDYEVSLARNFGQLGLKLAWTNTSGYTDELAESLGERHLAGNRLALTAGFEF